MKKWKIIPMVIIGTILIAGISVGKTESIQQNKSYTTITGLSYQNGIVTATVHSEISCRTIVIKFYKSRIIGGSSGITIPIGSVIIGMNAGETTDVSIPFFGLGNFIITAKLLNGESYSQEIQIPKNKIIFDLDFLIFIKNFLNNIKEGEI